MKNKFNLIIEGNIVDILNRDIFPGVIYISNGKIVQIRKSEKEYNNFILPGFVDSHVHIESSLLCPSAFGEVAIKHGVLAAVADPHEIANVLGVEGVAYMINNAKNCPFRFYFGAPSCVPATSFDCAGANIDKDQIEFMFSKGMVHHLGEMMNFPGVINDKEEVIQKLLIAKKYYAPIDGHAPGLSGINLKKYCTSGITTDHECSDINEAIEKISFGMKILIRQGSAARNLSELAPLLNTNPDSVMFCTDDCHAGDLLKGYLRLIVIKLLNEGYNLFDVLRAASLNPIKHYNLDIGLLQTGDSADFIIVDDLKEFNVKQLYINGKESITYSYDSNIVLLNNFNAIELVKNDININRISNRLRVIEVIDKQIITRSLIHNIKNLNNWKDELRENDILKIVVLNRYKPYKPSIGFVKGFGFKYGAIASSISHDSHNIIAVGYSDTDIVKAMNLIIGIKGGICFSGIDKNIVLPLPIAGLMSDKNAEYVAKIHQDIEIAINNAGCSLSSPLMNLSFLSLPVIPELKITCNGLFDSNHFNFVNLFL
jgi:adenine deaminase